MLTDSVILAPDAMFVMNDQLWVFQRRKELIFDVFDIQTYKHLFSTGNKGRGPDEFTHPIGQTIQSEDDYFTIMDGVEMKTIVWLPNFGLHTIKSELIFNQPATNGFIRLNDSLFCAFADCAMGTAGDFEYQLKNVYNNTLHKFSAYPEYLANKKFEQEIRCQIYYKYLVANPVKRKFAAFYSRYKVLRLFSYEGVLEKEIHVKIPPYQIKDVENSEGRYYYYVRVTSTNQYIYAYCASNKEVQVWDWDGSPIIIYRLNKDYSRFTVSEKHKKVYLISAEEQDIDKIFVLDLIHL